MHNTPYARIEDILTGPWSNQPLFLTSFWSERDRQLALRTGGRLDSDETVRTCNQAAHNDLEVATLIALAVRTGFIPADTGREFIKLFVRGIISSTAGEEFIYRENYWAVIDGMVRLGVVKQRDGNEVLPISSNLQVDFASLLTTHRILRSDKFTNSALSLLSWGSIDRSVISTNVHASVRVNEGRPDVLSIEAIFAELEILEGVNKDFDSQSLVAQLFKGVYDVVDLLGQLYLPMDSAERGTLGAMYLRQLKNLNHGFLSKHAFQSFTSFAETSSYHKFERLMPEYAARYSFLFERVGLNASSLISESLEILKDTLRDVEALFWKKSAPGGGGGGQNQKDQSVGWGL